MCLKGIKTRLIACLLSLIAWPAQALIITDELEVIRIPNVGGVFQTVTSQQSYTTLIVVCTNVLSSSANNEVAVRIDNIGTSSFDVLLQNPDGDPVTAGDVYCILADEGLWTLPDGTIYEAHTVLSEGTYGRNLGWDNGTSENVSADVTGAYGANAQPAVLGQVMSYNDADYSVFHSYDCESRSNIPFQSNLADGICVSKHVGKTALVNAARENETLGYIVIEQAVGSFAGISYRSAVGADSVAGVDNSVPYTYALGAHYDFGVATQTGEDGGDGGWAVMYGIDPLDGNNLDLAIDEDTTNGSDRSHTTEQVAYWVFSGVDHSDAPITYGDASHNVIGVLSLGPSADGDADAELLAISSPDAQGDDGDGYDDENGVVFRSPNGTNDSIFADVEVTNPAGLTVNVCAWLDIVAGAAVDGDFDAADGQCQTTSLVNPTLTFQWSGLPDDQSYTTFARFRVSTDSITTANAIGAATDGEVEDYQVNFDFQPTAVTIGQVSIAAILVNDFIANIGVESLSDSELRNLLQRMHPSVSLETLADREAIEQTLLNYLDPDGDGAVVLFSWDTLEQRGTIGFYVERRQTDQSWLRINDDLLPAIIVAPMGAEYQLLDPTASPIVTLNNSPAYQYRLIELEATGALREYGPFDLSF